MHYSRLTSLISFSLGTVYALRPITLHSSRHEQRSILPERYAGSPQKVLSDITQLQQHHHVPVHNWRNIQYTIDIYIEDKPYRVAIDTGGSDLFIFQDGNETDEGDVSSAAVQIGDIKVENQSYGLISVPGFAPHLNGILGLTYGTDAVDQNVPLLKNMINQHLIEEPIFAVYLGDIDKNQSSEIVFGGVDESHFEGEITHLPLSRKGHWEVPLNSISFGDYDIELEETTAIFDAGTEMFVLPYSLAGIINHQLGAVVDPYGRAEVDCEKRHTEPDVTFTLRGKFFAVSAEEYILQAKGSSKSCRSVFVGWDLPSSYPVVILGDVFLRKWYSIYDAGDHTVGLAKAV